MFALRCIKIGRMKSPWFWGILAVALLARVALLASAWGHVETTIAPDSEGYWQLAQAIRDRHEFTQPSIVVGEYNPEIFRTPGYPLFLSPFASIGAALCLQIALDMLLVVLTYGLARRLVSNRVALFAMAFQAVSPLAVAASCQILSDGLFAFLLTPAVMLMVRFLGQCRLPEPADRAGDDESHVGPSSAIEGQGEPWRAYAWLVGAALLMAMASYVRPVGLALAAAFLMALVLVHRRFRKMLIFTAVFVACIAPWVARNNVVADYPGFSSVAAEGLYEYTLPEMDRQIDAWERISRSFVPEWNLPAARRTRMLRLSPGQAAQAKADTAREYILKHPLLFLKVHFKGTLAFWLPGATDVLEVAGLSQGNRGTLAVLHEQGLWPAVRHYFGGNTTAVAVAVPLVLIYLVKMAGVLVCVVAGARRILHLRPKVWLLVLLVLLSFILPGVAAHPRFRVPVEPILNIAAAMGWLWIVGLFNRRRVLPVEKLTR